MRLATLPGGMPSHQRAPAPCDLGGLAELSQLPAGSSRRSGGTSRGLSWRRSSKGSEAHPHVPFSKITGIRLWISFHIGAVTGA